LGNKDSSIGLDALIAKISRLNDAEMSAISAIVDSLEEARNQAVELVADSVGDPVAASPMNNGAD